MLSAAAFLFSQLAGASSPIVREGSLSLSRKTEPSLTVGLLPRESIPGASALEHKPGVSFFVALFPDGDDLFDGDVASFATVVLQMQDAAFHFRYFAAQAGSSATEDVDPSARECFQKFFHLR
jgi:hypothetical protein